MSAKLYIVSHYAKKNTQKTFINRCLGLSRLCYISWERTRQWKRTESLMENSLSAVFHCISDKWKFISADTWASSALPLLAFPKLNFSPCVQKKSLVHSGGKLDYDAKIVPLVSYTRNYCKVYWKKKFTLLI